MYFEGRRCTGRNDRTEVAQIAIENVGQPWTSDGCALFVWGVTNLAGLPFFDSQTSANDIDYTLNSDPREINAPSGVPVPHTALPDEPDDGWSIVKSPSTGSYSITSVSELVSVLLPGDVVRIYGKGNTPESGDYCHSFIVVSGTGSNIEVVDNWHWTSDGGVISEHLLSDITGDSAWVPFESAFVSRINTSYVDASVNQTTLQGNAFGSAGIWSTLGQSSSPTPSVSSVSPTSYPSDANAHTMEILGSNFVSGDTLTYTDPQGDIYPSTASKLTFVSSGEIEYQLDDDSDPGTWTVKVNSADGTVHSSAASFSVASAVPPPGTPQQGIDVRNVSISNYAENITTAGDAFVGQYIGVNSGYLTTADANTLQSAGLNIVSIYEKSGMSDTTHRLGFHISRSRTGRLTPATLLSLLPL